MSKESLEDLKRLAIAKHGEDHAYALAERFGNSRHKQPWRKALATPCRIDSEVLAHQQWQQSGKEKFLRDRPNKN